MREPDFITKAQAIRLTADEKREVREHVLSRVIKTDSTRLENGMESEALFRSAKNVRLRADEHARIREALFSNIERSDASRLRSLRFLRFVSGAMTAVMVFVVGGAGISFAAESALPGEKLYVVKVRVTEPLMVKLSANPEARARVRARLAERRMTEAEELAEKSELTPERAAIVQEELSLHVAALQSELIDVAATNKQASVEIGMDVSTDIEAHENVLMRIVAEKDVASAHSIVEMTRKARAMDMFIAHEDEEEPHDMMKSAAKKAEDMIAEVRISQTLDADVSVATTIENAEADLREFADETEDESMKLKKAKSALRKAKEAKIMMNLPGRAFFKNGIPHEEVEGLEESFELEEEAHGSEASISSSSSASSVESTSSTSSESESIASSTSSMSSSSSAVSSNDGLASSVNSSASSTTSASMSAASESSQMSSEDHVEDGSKKDGEKLMEDMWKKKMKKL